MALDWQPLIISFLRILTWVMDKFILDCTRFVWFITILVLITNIIYKSKGQKWVPILHHPMQTWLWAYGNTWEHKHIWQNNPFLKHLIFYWWYIDDIIIFIWDGAGAVIDEFVSQCNNNPIRPFLYLMYVADQEKLAFLDLDLYHTNDELHEKKYFKPTAGNSLLQYKSFHYYKWTNNIPKEPVCRLRSNCTKISDYKE